MNTCGRFFTGILGLTMAIAFCGCGTNGISASESNKASSDSNGGSSVSSSDSTGSVGSYVYDGIATAAPYVIYNEDGTKSTLAAFGNNSYGSLFLAIRNCGAQAKSSNKMYVKDAKGTIVFQRQSNASLWVYDGTNLVTNTMTAVQAKTYITEHSRSYIVNGQGTDYVYLGVEHFVEGRNPEDCYELRSGGHSYIYTPTGTLAEGGDGTQWAEYGYAYASATVRLSEATYYDVSEDGGGAWNAYVFFNIRNGMENCDLGIGTFAGGGGKWMIVQNCSSANHTTGATDVTGYYIDANGVKTEHGSHYETNANENKFAVFQDYVVTTMTKNVQTGEYSGADDIFLETWATADGWYLRVVNLATNEEWGYCHKHIGMNVGKEGYFRVVACSSYCPVDGSVWDARDGGYLKNVIWENSKVARYNNEDVYNDSNKEDLYVTEDSILYCYTQAADCAHLKFGIYDADGTHTNGTQYTAGTKYFVFSSYYDGTNMDD